MSPSKSPQESEVMPAPCVVQTIMLFATTHLSFRLACIWLPTYKIKDAMSSPSTCQSCRHDSPSLCSLCLGHGLACQTWLDVCRQNHREPPNNSCANNFIATYSDVALTALSPGMFQSLLRACRHVFTDLTSRTGRPSSSQAEVRCSCMWNSNMISKCLCVECGSQQ